MSSAMDSIAGLKVMVIDDSNTIRRSAEIFLSQAGCRVIVADDGFDALAHHWNVVEERAAHFGQTVSRRDWRLVGLMHIAETREQAYADVQYGIETWFRYFQKTAAFPQMAVEGGDAKEMIDFINEAELVIWPNGETHEMQYLINGEEAEARSWVFKHK